MTRPRSGHTPETIAASFRKTRPRSARGRRLKGNLGEREAKALLQSWGLTVLDGRMTEPGVDLILNPQAVVEVKNHPWKSLGGVARADLFKAAEHHRRNGVAHWCLFREPEGWLLARIGIHPKTFRVGLVFKMPLKPDERGITPYPPGFPKALAPAAYSEAPSPRADSRVVAEVRSKPDTSGTGNQVSTEVATRPAIEGE